MLVQCRIKGASEGYSEAPPSLIREMNRLIIHIGLPKTATTSLQRCVFSQEHKGQWNYCGIRQPRNQKQDKLYLALMNALDCREQQFESKRKDFVDAYSRLSTSKPLLISEEMVCIDTAVRWQEKLERLGTLTGNGETKILVTVRDSSEGAFSLYAELFHYIRNKYESFHDFFENSNQARIFRYDEIIPCLENQFGRENIVLVPFEFLREENKFLGKIGEQLGFDLKGVQLPLTNGKSKEKYGIRPHPITVADASRQVSNWCYRRSAIFGKLSRLLIKLSFLSKCKIELPWGNTLIPYPDFAPLKMAVRESSDWLRDHYGLDYVSADEDLFGGGHAREGFNEVSEIGGVSGMEKMQSSGA